MASPCASADFSDRHVLVIRKNEGWDFEKLDIDKVEASGKAIAGGSIAMTVLTWLVIAI